MAVFADRYDKIEAKKVSKKIDSKSQPVGVGRLFRINGSIVVGSKHTSFTKEVRAGTKPEALDLAFKELKEQHKVEVYQILVNSIKEGANL